MSLLDMYDYGIGNTPLVELKQVNGCRIFAKLETKNFLKSVKARTAYWMIRDALSVCSAGKVVESTSGNLGLALGYFCRKEGLDFLCLIDSTIAQKKRKLLEKENISYRMVQPIEMQDLRTSRIMEARRLAETEGYYWTNQYDNASGIKAHEVSTGPEIWEQSKGKLTHCVCPMGSGGTICGIGRYLKRTAPAVRICGVEPYGSTIFGRVDAPYINVGAGLRGMPGNIRRNQNVIDEMYTVKDSTSVACAQTLFFELGIDSGITGGMAYAAALEITKHEENAVIVILIPDGREAYDEYLR